MTLLDSLISLLNTLISLLLRKVSVSFVNSTSTYLSGLTTVKPYLSCLVAARVSALLRCCIDMICYYLSTVL